MHNLSVSLIFSSADAPLLGDFLDHWLSHGVDHFYMSGLQADSAVAGLLPYVEAGQVTLWMMDAKRSLGTEAEIYEQHLKHVLKCEGSKWIAMLCPTDLWDEDLGKVVGERLTSAVWFHHRGRPVLASGAWTPERLPQGAIPI